MKYISLLLSFVLFGCVLIQGGPNSRYMRTPAQMRGINHAVVALVAPDILDNSATGHRIYCTGAFINSTQILTAAHCVEGAETVRIGTFRDYLNSSGSFSHGRWSTFYVTRRNESVDLALLTQRAGEAVARHSTLNVSRYAPQQGENVIVVGHPARLGWTVTSGVVSSANRHGWGDIDYEDHLVPLFIQHDASVWFGNSGGPLLNYNNEIVGVVVQVMPSAPHLAMSVHTSDIRKFIRRSL